MNNGSEEARGQPAFRAIAKAIADDILVGKRLVGARLPSEQAMAMELKVSRSTMREAIRLLEQLGLLARQMGSNRLYVTAPNVTHMTERLRATFILQQTTFHELWEVMAAIEPMAAEAAARRATDNDLVRLHDNIVRTEAIHAEGGDLIELDIEFHFLIAIASANCALRLSRDTIGELFYPAFLQVMTRLNAGERLIVAHKEILSALNSRDERKARAWMERHIGDFKRGCELANLDFDGPITANLGSRSLKAL
jgi:GntR family transcriptional repressor for pyruvate dehydrogenase complex